MENNKDKVLSLLNKVSEIDSKIYELTLEKHEYQRKIAGIKLSPFKIGDEVMCPVSVGRSRKIQKCLIEVDDEGHVFVRPYKSDGKLSNRHFSVETAGVPYSEYFKKV